MGESRCRRYSPWVVEAWWRQWIQMAGTLTKRVEWRLTSLSSNAQVVCYAFKIPAKSPCPIPVAHPCVCGCGRGGGG